MRKLTVLLSVMLLIPTFSQAKTLEDLLVEKGVITKGEASASSAGGAKVYWNGGTRVDFPDQGFTTQINTLLQTGYTYTDSDDDTGAKNTSSFDVHDARLIVSGTALHNEFYYLLEPDFVSASDSDGEHKPRLLDAYIGWHACDWMSVQMGQFKTGISRQYNANEWSQQFVNQSVVSDYMNLGRQEGASFSSDWMDGQVKFGAGIFNGESTGEGINRSGIDTRHTVVLNARWAAMGAMDPYVEGDIDWTDDAALNLGAAWASSNGNNGDLEKNTTSIDANFKYQGWSFAGEYYFQTLDVTGGDNIEPQGFYTQLGYFVDPKTLEVAAQYALLDCDDGAACGANIEKINEVQVSVNYYWWKNNLKAQLGWSHENQRALEGDDVNTNKWMFELSSYF